MLVFFSLLAYAVGFSAGRESDRVYFARSGRIAVERPAHKTSSKQTTCLIQRFAVCMSYYNNSQALMNHFYQAANVHPELKPLFVVVDDGSKEDPLRNHAGKIWSLDPTAILVELTEDIGFNSGGARNTASLYVPDNIPVIYFTDVDLYLSQPQMLFWNQLAARVQEDGNIYRLNKVCNMFMIRREHWYRDGFYREDLFSGHYGFEDIELMLRFTTLGNELFDIPSTFINYDQRGVTDLDTKLSTDKTVMDKKLEHNRLLFEDLVAKEAYRRVHRSEIARVPHRRI